MPSSEDRIATATKAVQTQGISDSDKRAPWWLTDMGSGELKAMYVDAKGNINTDGKTVNNSGMGVRPAIWIKTE